MKRTFLKTTITAGGTPQPVFGTTTNGAITLATAAQSVVVLSSAHFAVGDSVIVDTSTNAEQVAITAIADGTHITGVFTKSHSSGVPVRLAQSCNTVYIQPRDGNTGSTFIGNSSSMSKSTFLGVISELKQVVAGAQPPEFSDSMNSGSVDPFDTSEFWIDGTTGDGYVPSIGVV